MFISEIYPENIDININETSLLQSFHMAGDGKLGGVVDPNDGQCHLNISGFYEWSKLQGKCP